MGYFALSLQWNKVSIATLILFFHPAPRIGLVLSILLLEMVHFMPSKSEEISAAQSLQIRASPLLLHIPNAYCASSQVLAFMFLKIIRNRLRQFIQGWYTTPVYHWSSNLSFIIYIHSKVTVLFLNNLYPWANFLIYSVHTMSLQTQNFSVCQKVIRNIQY